MKKIAKFLLLMMLILGCFVQDRTTVRAENEVVLHFFYSDTCSHCHDEGLFLDELETQYHQLTVIRYEVTKNAENRALFDQLMLVFNNAPIDYHLAYGSVPFTIIGGFAFTGFNEQRKADLENLIARYSETDSVDITEKVIFGQIIDSSDFDSYAFDPDDEITLPLIGTVKIEDLSLGVAAVILGTIDGFNPCAMWILILLITLLANHKDRKRMWILGSTFLFTSALVYFLVMISWINLAVSFADTIIVRVLIGLVALGLGFYQCYKAIRSMRNPEIGCEVKSAESQSKVIEKVKKIVREKSLLIALFGIIVLAFSVNIVELACSAGLPLLFTQILAFNWVTPLQSLGYILLYIVFFLLDDLIVFAIAMVSLRITGITTKYAKISSLIGGALMVVLGFLLLFFPQIIMFNF